MKKFYCTCGTMIEPPRIPPTLRLGDLQGTFKAIIEIPCPKCEKVHKTFYNGKLVREKV